MRYQDNHISGKASCCNPSITGGYEAKKRHIISPFDYALFDTGLEESLWGYGADTILLVGQYAIHREGGEEKQEQIKTQCLLASLQIMKIPPR